MPLININLNEAPDFEPVPAGTYSAVVEGVEVGKTRDGKRSLISYKMRLVDNQEVEGRTLKYTRTLPIASDPPETRDTMLAFLKADMKTFGVNWSDEGFNPEDAKGAQVTVEVSIEDYEGRPVNRVKLLG